MAPRFRADRSCRAGSHRLAPLIPGPVILKIKVVFIAFDVLLAFFTDKTVGLRRPGRTAVAAALVMALLPTVVVNASLYGQMDAMWASFALGGVYLPARGRGIRSSS